MQEKRVFFIIPEVLLKWLQKLKKIPCNHNGDLSNDGLKTEENPIFVLCGLLLSKSLF